MKKRNGRTYIDNALINDTSLSVHARFLYIYMSSQSEDWKFFRSAMCNVMCCSRKIFDKAIKELISAGLVQKGDKKTQSSKGVKGFGAVKYNVVSFSDHTTSDDTNSADTKSNHLRITNNKKNNIKEEQEEVLCTLNAREKKLSSIREFLTTDTSWRDSFLSKNCINESQLDSLIESTVKWMEGNAEKLTKTAAKKLVQNQHDINVAKDTLDNRKSVFGRMVSDIARKCSIPSDTVNEFFTYYTTANDKGKMRFETDEFFNIKFQLKKWIDNNGRKIV